MEYALFALGGVILALIGLFIVRATRRKDVVYEQIEERARLSPKAQLQKLQTSENLWGVSVESHCGASSKLVGQTFTFDVAPPLPVIGCTADACICSYIGLPERRLHGERRRGQDRRRALRMEGDERRAERPRREGEHYNWAAYRHL